MYLNVKQADFLPFVKVGKQHCIRQGSVPCKHRVVTFVPWETPSFPCIPRLFAALGCWCLGKWVGSNFGDNNSVHYSLRGIPNCHVFFGKFWPSARHKRICYAVSGKILVVCPRAFQFCLDFFFGRWIH